MITSITVSVRVANDNGIKRVEVQRDSTQSRDALAELVEEAVSSVLGERVRLLVPQDPAATMPVCKPAGKKANKVKG